MLFYTINNILLLLWSAIFCFRKPSRTKNIFFVYIAFTQLFLIMVFRNQIGYDYNMYTVGFNRMGADGFQNMTYYDWETGFVLVTKLLTLILPNYIWYIGVLSVVAILPAAIFICKNSEMPWLSTILYVNMFIFFMEMNFLRQMIALSLVMLAWHFMKKNKFIPFAVVILIASVFHQTVLILLPVYLLIKMQPNFKELIIYGYFILWFYMSSEGFIDIVTNFYHEEYSNSIFVTEGLSLVYAILPLVVTVITFILIKLGTINVTAENKYIINLSLICTILMVTMAKHSIIERLSYYFSIFFILLVPVVYRSLAAKGISASLSNGKTLNLTSDRQKKLLSTGFLILILALSYFHFYYGLNEQAHGCIPYDTWLRFEGLKQVREILFK